MAKLYIEIMNGRREAGLGEVGLIEIYSEDAIRAPPLHLDRVKTGIAADIEDCLAAQIGGNGMRKVLPFDPGIISQKMIGSGADAPEIKIVKPIAKFPDPVANSVRVESS